MQKCAYTRIPHIRTHNTFFTFSENSPVTHTSWK